MNLLNIFWFRRDLRLNDNHALFKILKKGNVLPVFILDKDILNKLTSKEDKRISFIYKELSFLKKSIEKYESSLLIDYNTPLQFFKELIKKYKVGSVYFNHDYEPYALQRDKEVTEFLVSKGIQVFSFKDQVIFEKEEVVKKDSQPYTIFTPYSRVWEEKYKSTTIENYNSENLLKNLYKTKPFEIPSIESTGFVKDLSPTPQKKINNQLISAYDKTRDFPFLNGTTRLGIHLRFGTISIRELIKVAFKLNETFLNELIWREFYMMILWHFPHVEHSVFNKKYNYLEWRNNEKEFDLWCQGKTGYPIVDAGMRELTQTGYMHNRLRMITASFLTKHLLINWQWGEAFFAEHLLDYELASNNGGWQWAAGTGCDAVPYFRIFNPYLQTKKFDPDLKYIKKWLPEYDTPEYPEPIIDHKLARERTLRVYKKI